MDPSYVLKFSLDDSTGAVVLVHAAPNGRHELDLDLVATDGDTAFRGKGEICSGAEFGACR